MSIFDGPDVGIFFYIEHKNKKQITVAKKKQLLLLSDLFQGLLTSSKLYLIHFGGVAKKVKTGLNMLEISSCNPDDLG